MPDDGFGPFPSPAERWHIEQLERQRMEHARSWASLTEAERQEMLDKRAAEEMAKRDAEDARFRRQRAQDAALASVDDPIERFFLSMATHGILERACHACPQFKGPPNYLRSTAFGDWFAARARERDIPFDTEHTYVREVKRLLGRQFMPTTERAWTLRSIYPDSGETLVLESGTVVRRTGNSSLFGTDVMLAAVRRLGLKLNWDS